jgi:hypothetical protein
VRQRYPLKNQNPGRFEMLEHGSYRMTIQVTLVDFKWSVGRHLVTEQDCLVHERRITDLRILDRLAKTQNMRVKMRLVNSGNALEH